MGTTGRLKAIETKYNGYRFRSRLEARWAVFFDTLGIVYEYEPQGYELDKGRYLPDFWIPKQECWIEIKGIKPTSREQGLAHSLAQTSGNMAYIFWGDIPRLDGQRSLTPYDSAFACFPDGSGDEQYYWCICPDCGYLDIQFEGRSDRLRCKESYILAAIDAGIKLGWTDKEIAEMTLKDGCPRHSGNLDKAYTNYDPRILEAYDLARQARFEYGERSYEHKMYDASVGVIAG